MTKLSIVYTHLLIFLVIIIVMIQKENMFAITRILYMPISSTISTKISRVSSSVDLRFETNNKVISLNIPFLLRYI